jgi:kumamolisin
MASTSKAKRLARSRKSARSKARQTVPKQRSASAKLAKRKRHVVVRGSSRDAVSGAVRVGDADPSAYLEVTITLRGPALPAAKSLATRGMSLRQFEARFGAARADVDKVARVLRPYGLRVLRISRATRSMQVGGSVQAMEEAFHPNLGMYKSAGQEAFRDREGDYKVPAELSGIVTSVLGLGQRRVAWRRPFAKVAKKISARPPGLAPSDFERLYSFPEGDARGQKIAIAEFGGGYSTEDLKTFCAKHGRRPPRVKYVGLSAPARTVEEIMHLRRRRRLDELDSTIEVMMDVEIIAALCPKAEIAVYFTKFNQKGWVDLLDEVIRERPVVLSISWGSAEDSKDWSKAAVREINDRLYVAAALGITICCASGDDGSGDDEHDGRAHVDFPGSSPFVLSVGGTMMTRTARERVWWERPGRRVGSIGGSTGGGVSVCFQRPPWQRVRVASLNKDSIAGRIVPDVAALAGKPMYDTIIRGKDHAHGGTSASAPLWAALIARINALLPPRKRQRFLPPLIYKHNGKGEPVGRTACCSITIGHNTSYPKPGKGYRARAGYDAVTGWGTPIGTALLTALRSG